MDVRNFRSSYLEKVGIKGVEEKKSIEILLKEQPLDAVKLSQFCFRFPVPAAYRLFLWKVLLGESSFIDHLLLSSYFALLFFHCFIKIFDLKGFCCRCLATAARVP